VFRMLGRAMAGPELSSLTPCSEPEAEMLRALAASWKPHVWVNVHSGMEALFMPYDHRAEVLQSVAID
jgi:hypothetical protein